MKGPCESIENVYYSSQRNREMERLSQDGYRKWSMLKSIDGNPDCWEVFSFLCAYI